MSTLSVAITLRLSVCLLTPALLARSHSFCDSYRRAQFLLGPKCLAAPPLRDLCPTAFDPHQPAAWVASSALQFFQQHHLLRKVYPTHCFAPLPRGAGDLPTPRWTGGHVSHPWAPDFLLLFIAALCSLSLGRGLRLRPSPSSADVPLGFSSSFVPLIHEPLHLYSIPSSHFSALFALASTPFWRW